MLVTLPDTEDDKPMACRLPRSADAVASPNRLPSRELIGPTVVLTGSMEAVDAEARGSPAELMTSTATLKVAAPAVPASPVSSVAATIARCVVLVGMQVSRSGVHEQNMLLHGALECSNVFDGSVAPVRAWDEQSPGRPVTPTAAWTCCAAASRGVRIELYLSYSNRHADMLFELVSPRRYLHKSTIVTTNRRFAQWSEVWARDPSWT
jgi:hypothetical protein